MQWVIPKSPNEYEHRVTRVFLWLPLVLRSKGRWLEFAKIHQVYTKGDYIGYWKDIEWAEGLEEGPIEDWGLICDLRKEQV